MATLAVVPTVADYGAAHDEELLVVPVTLRMVDPPSRSPPAWKMTKWMWASILGLTATAVVSSASVLFVSILDFSKQEGSAQSFLLRASGGADDDKCVPASGPWPTDNVSRQHSDVDDDDQPYHLQNQRFKTCFSLRGGEDYCWSHSYYDSGDWNPCKPNGFGPQGWAFVLTRNGVGNIETCGTGCTKFA